MNVVAKLFVAGLVMLLCWNVIQSMLFVPTSRIENRRPLGSASSRDESEQLFADFTAGSWKFGAMDWNLRVYPETEETGLLDPPSHRRAASSSFNDQKFIDLLTNLGAQPKEVGNGCLMWQSANQTGIPLVLFTQNGVVQVMRTRSQTPTGSSIVEGRPYSAVEKNQEFLMPITDGINQVASRVDAQGRLTSAILKIDSQFRGDIRAIWKEQGWEVTPITDFSNAISKLAAERYRCEKNHELVEATIFLDSEARPDQVVLNCIQRAAE